MIYIDISEEKWL